jgi:hypothetical protein
MLEAVILGSGRTTPGLFSQSAKDSPLGSGELAIDTDVHPKTDWQ